MLLFYTFFLEKSSFFYNIHILLTILLFYIGVGVLKKPFFDEE